MTFDLGELFGNEDLKNYISGVVQSGSIPSSFFIEGPKGSGRRTFVKLLFKTLCCNGDIKPCGKCPSCRKIDNGNSVDLRYFGIPDGKKSIGVDVVRKIKEDCMIGSSDGDYKFYIISDAEYLTPAAQNALLKITEEPPQYAKFFFICESGMILLPTLRSRAVTVRMQRIDVDPMIVYLVGHDKTAEKLNKSDKEKLRDVALLSGGSIGKALSLLRKRNLDAEPVSGFLKALDSGVPADIHAALLALPDTRNEYKEALDDISTAVSDKIRGTDAALAGYLSEVYRIITAECENFIYNPGVSLSKRYLCVCISGIKGLRKE